MLGHTNSDQGSAQRHVWTGHNLEGARGEAVRALTSATRTASELGEAIGREPELRTRFGPLAEKMFAAAEAARLVEHELAAALAERRRAAR